MNQNAKQEKIIDEYSLIEDEIHLENTRLAHIDFVILQLLSNAGTAGLPLKLIADQCYFILSGHLPVRELKSTLLDTGRKPSFTIGAITILVSRKVDYFSEKLRFVDKFAARNECIEHPGWRYQWKDLGQKKQPRDTYRLTPRGIKALEDTRRELKALNSRIETFSTSNSMFDWLLTNAKKISE